MKTKTCPDCGKQMTRYYDKTDDRRITTIIRTTRWCCECGYHIEISIGQRVDSAKRE